MQVEFASTQKVLRFRNLSCKVNSSSGYIGIAIRIILAGQQLLGLYRLELHADLGLCLYLSVKHIGVANKSQ